MKNGIYTAFCKKPQEPVRLETCLIETESEEEFKKAITRAKDNGLEITRIYKPEAVLDLPDFISCINL